MATLKDILIRIRNNNPQASHIMFYDGTMSWTLKKLLDEAENDTDEYQMEIDGIYRLHFNGEREDVPSFSFATPAGQSLQVFPDGIRLG